MNTKLSQPSWLVVALLSAGVGVAATLGLSDGARTGSSPVSACRTDTTDTTDTTDMTESTASAAAAPGPAATPQQTYDETPIGGRESVGAWNN